MPLKLYKIDASPPVRAVLMTAEILKLNLELHELNITIGEQMTPEYLEKNPLHSVPFLEDDDFLLPDSHAIITYLVSKYGTEKRATLYPSELSVRATIDARMYFDTTILFSKVSGIVKTVMTGAKEITPEQVKDANAAYDILEKYLQKTKFVAGNHLTVADVSCVATISTLDALVPVDDKYGMVKAWWSSIQEEDWYQKRNLPGLTQFVEFMKKWQS